LSLHALACGLDSVLAAGAGDGNTAMRALRAKSLALTDLFLALLAQHCTGHGLALVTPRPHAQRGSQVSVSRAEGAYAIMQALITRGVIGDFRAGDPMAAPEQTDRHDIMRFGFTPLYTSYTDVWHASVHLQQVLEHGEWQSARFHRKQAVT
jgi:kynureninase